MPLIRQSRKKARNRFVANEGRLVLLLGQFVLVHGPMMRDRIFRITGLHP
jgi:hypothetical protein